MSSVAVISYDCTTDCFYCGNESGSSKRNSPMLGPEETSWWAEVSDTLRGVPEGKSLGFSDELIFSGGEITLPKSLPALESGALEAARKGLSPTINSNAWFAGSVDSAREMISRLEGRWHVSTGEGHLRKIPPKRIANAFIALAEEGREGSLMILSTRGLSSDEILREICIASPNRYSLSDNGDYLGVRLPSGESVEYRIYRRTAGQYGRGKGDSKLAKITSSFCNPEPTLSPDRENGGLLHIYPCCAFPGEFLENRALSFGRGNFPSAEQVIDSLSEGWVSQSLATKGKSKTAQELRISGKDVPYFESACGLCRYAKAELCEK